jgi:hypothetical protein
MRTDVRRLTLLLLGGVAWGFGTVSCDENRCESSQRSVYEDTQVFRGCVGDRIRFLPREVVLLGASGPSGGAASGGGVSVGGVSSGGGLIDGSTGGIGLGGSDDGSGGQAAAGGSVAAPASVESRSEAIQLIVEGTNGWRRDHAQVPLYLERCPGAPLKPFPIVLKGAALEGESGCTGSGASIVCRTNPDGIASFSVEALPYAVAGETTLVCPDWQVLKGSDGTYNSKELAQRCLRVHVGFEAEACPDECAVGSGSSGMGGCANGTGGTDGM